jgi:hypothetical protein
MTMSDRTKVAAQAKNIVFVPLNRLKKSPKNVRKIPHTKADIRSLAASIGAIGMIQYPVVEPDISAHGKPSGFYLVNAAEGSRQLPCTCEQGADRGGRARSGDGTSGQEHYRNEKDRYGQRCGRAVVRQGLAPQVLRTPAP